MSSCSLLSLSICLLFTESVDVQPIQSAVSQPITISSTLMNIPITGTDWISYIDGSFNAPHTSRQCDESVPENTACWELCFNTYVYRTVSTIGYKDIQLRFTLEPRSMYASSEQCQILYNTKDTTNIDHWIPVFSTTGDGRAVNTAIILPSNTWNINNLGIKISPYNAQPGNGCCEISYVKVSGNSITQAYTPVIDMSIPRSLAFSPAKTDISIISNQEFMIANNISELINSNECDQSDRPAFTDCYAICGDKYIESVHSTIGYDDVAIEFALKVLNMDSVNQHCQILYNVNDMDNPNDWIPLYTTNKNGISMYSTLILPEHTWHISALGIKVHANTNDMNSCCLLSYMKLVGNVNNGHTAAVKRDIIWYQAMESNVIDTYKWTISANTIEYQEGANSDVARSDCPLNHKENNPCWAICNGFMFRETSTVGYTDVSLTYSIDPWAMYVTDGTFCEISWSIGDGNWTIIGEKYDSSHEIIAHTEYLDVDTWNVQSLYIRIYAHNTNSNCCYMSDFYLSGVSPHTPQTAVPTTTYTSANINNIPTTAPIVTITIASNINNIPTTAPTITITIADDSENSANANTDTNEHLDYIFYGIIAAIIWILILISVCIYMVLTRIKINKLKIKRLSNAPDYNYAATNSPSNISRMEMMMQTNANDNSPTTESNANDNSPTVLTDVSSVPACEWINNPLSVVNDNNNNNNRQAPGFQMLGSISQPPSELLQFSPKSEMQENDNSNELIDSIFDEILLEKSDNDMNDQDVVAIDINNQDNEGIKGIKASISTI